MLPIGVVDDKNCTWWDIALFGAISGAGDDHDIGAPDVLTEIPGVMEVIIAPDEIRAMRRAAELLCSLPSTALSFAHPGASPGGSAPC